MDYVKALAKEIDAVNVANGFDPPDWDNLPIKLMLVVTELHEGYEAVYDNTEDTLDVELADTAIRLMSILNTLWGARWNFREPSTAPKKFGPLQSYEEMIWPVIKHLTKATEYWRKENKADAGISLELALKEVCTAAQALHFNLFAAIEAKVAKNAKRGHLHGKARTDG